MNKNNWHEGNPGKRENGGDYTREKMNRIADIMASDKDLVTIHKQTGTRKCLGSLY